MESQNITQDGKVLNPIPEVVSTSDVTKPSQGLSTTTGEVKLHGVERLLPEGFVSTSYNGGELQPVWADIKPAGTIITSLKHPQLVTLQTPRVQTIDRLKHVQDVFVVPLNYILDDYDYNKAARGEFDSYGIHDDLFPCATPDVTGSIGGKAVRYQDTYAWKQKVMGQFLPNNVSYDVKPHVLYARAYTAAYNRFLRHKGYMPRLSEYTSTTVTASEKQRVFGLFTGGSPSLIRDHGAIMKAPARNSYLSNISPNADPQFEDDMKDSLNGLNPSYMSITGSGIDQVVQDTMLGKGVNPLLGNPVYSPSTRNAFSHQSWQQQLLTYARRRYTANLTDEEVIGLIAGVDPVRTDRPQHISHRETPLNYSLCPQTSSTSGEPSGLGSNGAYSQTQIDTELLTSPLILPQDSVILILNYVTTEFSFEEGINRKLLLQNIKDFFPRDMASTETDFLMRAEINGTNLGAHEGVAYKPRGSEYNVSPSYVQRDCRSLQLLDVSGNPIPSVSPYHNQVSLGTTDTTLNFTLFEDHSDTVISRNSAYDGGGYFGNDQIISIGRVLLTERIRGEEH